MTNFFKLGRLLGTVFNANEHGGWVMPVDGDAGYMKDERVKYNGGVWLSLIDDNLVEPGTDNQAWVKV